MDATLRSQDGRLSSRSRSPASRRADRRRSRSRNRSPSTGSYRSEDEEKRRKKDKKKLKKEKKRHKKHKKDDDDVVAVSVSVEVETAMASDSVAVKEVNTDPADARSYFDQLQRREAAKQPVGTIHARNGPAPVSATAISTLDKWECSKAGCGHKNSKHAPACNKCGAMKRLTEWR